MPAVTLDTLADIRGKHRIWCYCRSCRRDVPLDLDQLAGHLGWQASLVNIKARLRCSGCGSREVLTSLVYDQPPASAVAYISLQE